MLRNLWLATLFAFASAATANAQNVPEANIPTADEVHPGIVVEPVVMRTADGTQLRAVVTKPNGARRRLPAILYVQWLSCDTVAIPATPSSGWDVMLQRLVRETGALVWRTEKRGVGGSEGRCASLDYETELSDHRTALAALRARPDVDPARIVIFGASMGSNMAPLLGQDENLAGVVVWGGGARTWAERTLAFERNRVELDNSLASNRGAELSAIYRFTDNFLIEKRTPQQIIAQHPELAAIASRMGVSEAGMFGRPLPFHWQAQLQNWSGAWSRVRAPVLAMVGEYDWFEDPAGVFLIGDIVNRGRPGAAQVRVIPGLDHHFSRFSNRLSAFENKGGIIDPAPAMEVLLPWLAERINTTQRSGNRDHNGSVLAITPAEDAE